MKSGLDAMPLFLLDDLLRKYGIYFDNENDGWISHKIILLYNWGLAILGPWEHVHWGVQAVQANEAVFEAVWCDREH